MWWCNPKKKSLMCVLTLQENPVDSTNKTTVLFAMSGFCQRTWKGEGRWDDFFFFSRLWPLQLPYFCLCEPPKSALILGGFLCLEMANSVSVRPLNSAGCWFSGRSSWRSGQGTTGVPSLHPLCVWRKMITFFHSYRNIWNQIAASFKMILDDKKNNLRDSPQAGEQFTNGTFQVMNILWAKCKCICFKRGTIHFIHLLNPLNPM